MPPLLQGGATHPCRQPGCSCPAAVAAGCCRVGLRIRGGSLAAARATAGGCCRVGGYTFAAADWLEPARAPRCCCTVAVAQHTGTLCSRALPAPLQGGSQRCYRVGHTYMAADWLEPDRAPPLPAPALLLAPGGCGCSAACRLQEAEHMSSRASRVIGPDQVCKAKQSIFRMLQKESKESTASRQSGDAFCAGRKQEATGATGTAAGLLHVFFCGNEQGIPWAPCLQADRRLEAGSWKQTWAAGGRRSSSPGDQLNSGGSCLPAAN